MRSILLVLLGICVGAAVVWFVLGTRDPGGPPPAPERAFVYVPSELRPLDSARITVDEALQTEVVADELLVALADDVDESAFAAAMRQRGLPVRVVGRLPSVRSLQIEVPADRRREIQQALAQDPRLVASAGANFIYRGTRTFNDPFLQEEDEYDWGLRKIGAFEAWDVTTGGAVVAVLDSGSKLDHEELDGKAVAPYSYATRSAAMQRQKFTNRHGGTDYVTAHGTHVAVTIAGRAGNDRGTAGVAPDSTHMPIQVLYLNAAGNDVVGSTAEIVDGILRAVGEGAKVINMSLGGSPSEATLLAYQQGSEADRRPIDQALVARAEQELRLYARAVDIALAERVVIVKAAGNDAVPARWDPLCRSGRVIGVAATGPDDERADFGTHPVTGLNGGSNHGPGTTVSAPGLGIWSAHPSPSGYVSFQGTSMAAPHVAGLVALLKTKKPDLTFEEVRDILIASGRPLTTDQPIGPLVNAPAALAELDRRTREGVSPPPAMPPIERPPSPPVDPVPPAPPGLPPTPTPTPAPVPGPGPVPTPPPADVPPPDHVRPPPPDEVPPPDHVRPPPPDEVPPPEHVRPPPPTDLPPPVRTPPPFDDDDAPPPDGGAPPAPPTYEEILKGPKPWENPQVQVRIESWLSRATPVAALSNPDAGPWRFDRYGRALGARMVRNAGNAPDWASYRYRYLWENARAYGSTNLGTLYEYLHNLPYTAINPPDLPTPPSPPSLEDDDSDPPGPGIGDEGLPDTPLGDEEPPTALVTVPDVRGRMVGDAERTLRRAGFDLKVEPGATATSRAQVGQIQTMKPRPGSRVPAGTRITLTMYMMPPADDPPTPVPPRPTPPTPPPPPDQPLETDAYCLVCVPYFPKNAPERPEGMSIEAYLRSVDYSRLEYLQGPSVILIRLSRAATRTYRRSVFKPGYRFSLPAEIPDPDGSARTNAVSFLLEVRMAADSYEEALPYARTLQDDRAQWKPEKNTITLTRADGSFDAQAVVDQAGITGYPPVAGWPPAHVRRILWWIASLGE